MALEVPDKNAIHTYILGRYQYLNRSNFEGSKFKNINVLGYDL